MATLSEFIPDGNVSDTATSLTAGASPRISPAYSRNRVPMGGGPRPMAPGIAAGAPKQPIPPGWGARPGQGLPSPAGLPGTGGPSWSDRANLPKQGMPGVSAGGLSGPARDALSMWAARRGGQRPAFRSPTFNGAGQVTPGSMGRIEKGSAWDPNTRSGRYPQGRPMAPPMSPPPGWSPGGSFADTAGPSGPRPMGPGGPSGQYDIDTGVRTMPSPVGSPPPQGAPPPNSPPVMQSGANK